MPLNFTKRQWMTLLIIGLADFCNAICVSLQAPFFPKEAEKKGATATEYGFVFGVFELVVFILSPFYGKYLNKIGPKILFNGGILTSGLTAILFGLLDRVEGHSAFIGLAFFIRIVEAMGSAAFLTASFAIIAKEFPNNVATTFASLETFFGLGLIVGPMVGGFLYSIGGYYLPFVVLGSTLFITALFTMCILPKHTKDGDIIEKGPSMKRVLRIPSIMVNSVEIFAASASIGFLSATLEPHLRPFNLSPILLGMVFVINGGIYAVTAPMWGWSVDKFLNPKISSLVGSILIAFSFCMVGPVSFLPIETQLSTIIFGLVLHGIGISAILVSSFTDALRSCIKHGFPDNIETYGLISGLWTSTFALGAFVGPSVSGLLYDSIGFRSACIYVVVMLIIVAIIICFFLAFEKRQNPYKELTSDESIIKSNDKLFSKIEDKISLKRNLGSMENFVTIEPITSHACTMNHILMNAGSYSHQISKNQWSIRLENEPPHGPYYGSLDGVYHSHQIYSETIA